MNTIQAYTDATYCDKRTFRIYTMIWGNPDECKLFEKEASRLVNANRSYLGGSTFKEFHLTKLKAKTPIKTWNTYYAFVDLLISMIRDQKLFLITDIVAEKKYNNNFGFLSEKIIESTINKNKDIGKSFAEIPTKDLPLIYHQIKELYLLCKYRNLFGPSNPDIHYFPDAAGATAHYQNKEFLLKGTLPQPLPNSITTSYHTVLQMLGDAILKATAFYFKESAIEGWPQTQQNLKTFQPLASQLSYLIQACDLISHSFLNIIRTESGLEENINYKKASLITRHLNNWEVFRDFFSISEGKTICHSEDFWLKIPFQVKPRI